jgi:hypothetical protein
VSVGAVQSTRLVRRVAELGSLGRNKMKLAFLILIPLTGALVLTHFISGWSDLRSALSTFAACFFIIGGTEGIAFFVRGK